MCVQGRGRPGAKAIANAWQRPLLRRDSGACTTATWARARSASHTRPGERWARSCFGRRVEKAFASAASRSTDGGLSQRMFGTLLTWMQEHTAPVFLVATANDIEALPPELLRKGRFDEIFFVDLPGGDARARIAAIHIAKRGRDPRHFDLSAIAAASDGYSGAEIEQAVVAALHLAYAGKSELTTELIVQALAECSMSVTMADHVRALGTGPAPTAAPRGTENKVEYEVRSEKFFRLSARSHSFEEMSFPANSNSYSSFTSAPPAPRRWCGRRR